MAIPHKAYTAFVILTIISMTNHTICNEHNCPFNSGECIDNSLCICAPGYTTFEIYNTGSLFVFCNYAYKYKDWAAWFEMFLPFGVGHFYSRRYCYGSLKFVLFWFLSFVKVIFKKAVRGYPNLLKVSQILLWVFGILYVVDYFSFTFDFYLDGNKMKML